MSTNSTFGLFPLIPAYGRDYMSLEALKRDFLAGKDFQAVSGQYCNIRELRSMRYRYAEFRFNRMSQTAEVRF